MRHPLPAPRRRPPLATRVVVLAALVAVGWAPATSTAQSAQARAGSARGSARGSAQTTRTATARAELRSAPSSSAGVVGVVPRGTTVQAWTCALANGAWCAVTADGRPGYVRARDLSGATRAATGRGAAGARGAARAQSFAPQSSAPLSSARPQGAERGGGTASGYYRGPRGGCYTLTAGGRKKYVDRSYCGG